jgi:hypothetical protein
MRVKSVGKSGGVRQQSIGISEISPVPRKGLTSGRKQAQDAFRYNTKRASLDVLAVDAKFHVALYPH